MRFQILGLSFLLVLAFPTAGMAETVRIEADRDATLIEHPAGDLANGSGPAFFAGRTGQRQDSVRRALLRFDVASVLPRQAIIERVSLTLFLNPSNPAPRELRLYRLLDDWGEGASSSSGGGGRPAESGDATWLHTFYDSEFWIRPGGRYLGRVSARLEVGDSAFYTWETTPHLVQDVRLWSANPRQNFGWILIGDETEPQTAKSFVSREHPDPARRPVLEVTYRAPGSPDAR